MTGERGISPLLNGCEYDLNHHPTKPSATNSAIARTLKVSSRFVNLIPSSSICMQNGQELAMVSSEPVSAAYSA